MKKLVWKYLWLTVASVIYSCGVSSFIDANNFAPGGVSGLCISLNRLIPLEIGTLFFLLNIPILAEVVTSKVLDLILYGTDGAKLLYIISDHSERIAERILIEIDSGVTYLEGKGAYQNTDKKVILCVIRKQNMQKMEDIVRMEDENAFMIVSSASEIYGEGYKSYFMEKL